MKVEFLQNKQIQKVSTLIQGFALRYVMDLNDFVRTTEYYGRTSLKTAEHLCQLLKKWKACRPSPYNKDLLPLLKLIDSDLAIVETVNLRTIQDAPLNIKMAIKRIWLTLNSKLCENRQIAEIAASKAMLILTNGKLGPALDSNVRKALKLQRIHCPNDYLALLFAISEDIAIFEKANQTILEKLVPKEWHPIEIGRAYDMAIGPREQKT